MSSVDIKVLDFCNVDNYNNNSDDEDILVTRLVDGDNHFT